MAPQSTSSAAVPLVAVVDDDLAVCNSLKFSLELEGFTVETFRSGGELLDAAEHGAIDLTKVGCFVVDQRMPGMTGMELIAALRERKVTRPAILVISQSNPALARRAGTAEITVVEKPFLGNLLVDKIREACAN